MGHLNLYLRQQHNPDIIIHHFKSIYSSNKLFFTSLIWRQLCSVILRLTENVEKFLVVNFKIHGKLQTVFAAITSSRYYHTFICIGLFFCLAILYMLVLEGIHYVKCVQIRSYFWSVFSRIRTEYGEIRSIQSECGKIRTRKNSVFGHFSRSDLFSDIWLSFY